MIAQTIKLHELPPRPSVPIKIYGLRDDATGEDVIVLYRHIDGAYSYCTIEDRDDGSHVHLSASTPLHHFQDGYIIAESEVDHEHHKTDGYATK
jgi:hypothetical protein